MNTPRVADLARRGLGSAGRRRPPLWRQVDVDVGVGLGGVEPLEGRRSGPGPARPDVAVAQQPVVELDPRVLDDDTSTYWVTLSPELPAIKSRSGPPTTTSPGAPSCALIKSLPASPNRRSRPLPPPTTVGHTKRSDRPASTTRCRSASSVRASMAVFGAVLMCCGSVRSGAGPATGWLRRRCYAPRPKVPVGVVVRLGVRCVARESAPSGRYVRTERVADCDV